MSNRIVKAEDLDQFARLVALFTERGLAFIAIAAELEIHITGY